MVLKQPQRLFVPTQDLCLEVFDSVHTPDLSEVSQPKRPDTEILMLIIDGQRNLSGSRRRHSFQLDIPTHPNDPLPLLVLNRRHQRDMTREVHFREVRELRIGEALPRLMEAEVHRLSTEPAEPVEQSALVIGSDGPDEHLSSVAQILDYSMASDVHGRYHRNSSWPGLDDWVHRGPFV